MKNIKVRGNTGLYFFAKETTPVMQSYDSIIFLKEDWYL